MVEFIPLFSSPVIKIQTKPDFDDIRSDFIKFCYRERENDSRGMHRSNQGGWHSELLLTQERFIKYRDFLEKFIVKSFQPYIKSSATLDVNSFWININGPGAINSVHNHPGSHLSGVFWVKATEYSGSLGFSNPNDFIHYPLLQTVSEETKGTYSFSEKYFFRPIEGDMVIFPSNMNHFVHENEDCEDRISIAFNMCIYEQD